jgi:hypothetical protein
MSMYCKTYGKKKKCVSKRSGQSFCSPLYLPSLDLEGRRTSVLSFLSESRTDM